MSAPPFFLLAGREDPKLCGENDGPAVVVLECLSELEHEQWSKKMGRSKDWVVSCRSKKKDEQQRPFEFRAKEMFSNAASKQRPKQERRGIRKKVKGSQCAGKRGADRVTSNAQ